ncbi:MAG: extracellular solute-binding protein [Caldilineaceae bacterium]
MVKRSMSRRQFLQLAATVTVGTAVVACAGVGPAGQGAGAPAQEGTTVTFMSIGGEPDQVMFQEALKVANEQAAISERNILIEWQPDPGGGWDKIMAMFASDTAYDVQRIDDDRVAELALNNKIHQLDCLMDLYEMQVDDYLPLFWQTINLGGYQYSMNPMGGTNVLYYNVDLFAEAGLEDPPASWADAWEWDEFLGIAEKLAKKDANGKPDQYALGFPKNVITPIAYGAGGSYLNPEQTECTMTDSAVADAVQQFLDHTVPGGPEWFVPPGLDLTELFNAGKLALIWASSNFIPTISQEINWGVCPWMKTPLYAMTENYDRTFVISKSATDHEAAFLVMKTLCEQPAIDVFAAGGFGVPYLKAALESEAFTSSEPANKQVWIETFGDINGHRVDVPTPRGPASSYKVTFTDGTFFDAAMTGQMSAQEFLKQACAKAEQDLSGWNWSAGQMEARLIEAGAVGCEGTKMWPETDWP